MYDVVEQTNDGGVTSQLRTTRDRRVNSHRDNALVIISDGCINRYLLSIVVPIAVYNLLLMGVSIDIC